jgi:sortase B
MLPEYQLIYEMNTDMVGWITIPDTKINYPVMQTPDNKDYYLNRNFNKLWSDWGSIYALEACDINSPSDNVTLYGHHMKDGSMFAELDKFKQEYFWKTHQTFTFDTLYEHHTYQIWAVFKTSADLDEGFAYHQFTNADSEEEFDQYVATIKSMQFYETGITPQYGDKLLCLSTCEYTLNDGRFVVMAMRIS